MLTRPRQLAAALATLATIATGCTSEAPSSSASAPSTVAPADALADGGVLSVGVGMILNTSSLTADRDDRLADVMAASASFVSNQSPAQVRVETVSIDELTDVSVAIDELVDRGVTVIATSCDDVSLRAVVDAAIEQSLLAVTGCVTIPSPDLSIDDRLFINLASLDDSGAAIAEWAGDQGLASLAMLNSDLIPDVEQTCGAIETKAAEVEGVETIAKIEFVGLVDDADSIVESVTNQLADVDGVVICALPPALGDVVSAVRNAGFDKPVLVPWFGELEVWDEATNDVFVFSPSSRHGDDPAQSVESLYEMLTTPEALDVVAADTLFAIATAANDAQSIGSRRIADALRNSTLDGVSGDLLVEPNGDNRIVVRSYRVLEISDGEPQFLDLIAAD